MLPIIGVFPWRVIEAYPRTHALEMELMAFPNHTLHAHMPQFDNVSTTVDPRLSEHLWSPNQFEPFG